MTDLQYSAMAWWYENGRKDAVLYVIDTDNGRTEVVRIENGVSRIDRSNPCESPIRPVVEGLFPELRSLDDAAFDGIRSRNMNAVFANADLPDEALIASLDNDLNAWLTNTVNFLHTEENIRVLLTGSAADFFPMEAALRRRYDDLGLDVYLDNPYLLVQPKDATPRRRLAERGQQLFRDGEISMPFEKDLSIMLLNEQGDEQPVRLASKGAVSPEATVDFWAAIGSEVTLLWGNERIAQSLGTIGEQLTKITVAAEAAAQPRVLFRNADGQTVTTRELR